MLKGGIVFADAVTTVSQTYAEEIKMPFYGEGLDGLMRARSNSLRGIVNGIDYTDFNPETDKHIVQPYSAQNFRKEKVKNKRALHSWGFRWMTRSSWWVSCPVLRTRRAWI